MKLYEPHEFRLFRWRRAMGVSWQEMMLTPCNVIDEDLFYMDQEEFYKPRKKVR
jgi:hypothetical protein